MKKTRHFFALVALTCGVAGARPSVDLPRAAEAPVIDGVLDEAAWATAAVIDGFGQVEPNAGAPPTERTEVRVFITARALYIGARCFDREPGGVLAKDRRRDSKGAGDDRLRVVIDPFGRGTEGYFFGLAAGGAKGDGVIREGRRPAMEWDTIWDAATRVDADGWVAEVEIPFRSISFEGGRSAWGFNIERVIRRREEVVRWASATRARSLYALEGAGEIVGMRELETGLGLDLKPTLVGRVRSGVGAEEGAELEPSLDAFYRLTPAMTATLTWRTDFAETEVDERVVNNSRFPLFFPEKRAFFLEDARHFRFGGIQRSPLPFHSRTVGLASDGSRVPIVGGGKVTGKAGRWNLGLMGVALEGTAVLGADAVFVGRIARDVGDESSVGGIFAFGDPRANGDAQTRGVDFLLRDSKLGESGQKTGELLGWALQTEDDVKDDYGWGLTARYPNDPFGAFVGVQRVGEDLDPAMGFVRRPGIYELTSNLSYELYPESERWSEVELSFSGALDTDLDLGALSESYRGRVEFDRAGGGGVSASLRRRREVFLDDFEISDGVVIPVGDYTNWDGVFTLRTPRSRVWSFGLDGSYGSFMEGDRSGAEAMVQWNPGALVSARATVEADWFRLPGGDFETVVANGSVLVTPSADLSLTTTVQFDNVSEEIGVNARLRWIVRPGSDVYLVFNQSLGYVDERARYESIAREAAMKVGWLVRF